MRRVVITGLGVVAPNGHNLETFREALYESRSGITLQPRFRELNFTCQVAGFPVVSEEVITQRFTQEQRRRINRGMTFAGLAAAECWEDAGLPAPSTTPDWDAGALIGTGIGGSDSIGDRLAPMTQMGEVRRMGSSLPEQSMCSNASALVGGMLGLGNRVSTNSSACATGTEAVLECYRHVAAGYAERMVAGSSEGDAACNAAGFDAMRVTARRGNDRPEQASRPMSATACGFVPAAGAGALLVESLDSALSRGARIYAEILGGTVNCGGQRNGGSITAANPEGVERCVRQSLRSASISGHEVDYINGHLTATGGDLREIPCLRQALDVSAGRFPLINSTKSLIGHALGAAGAIECVATLLQLHGGFLHASLNCEDLHPQLAPFHHSVVRERMQFQTQVALKVSFGFGDVNACVVFRRWA